MYLGNWLTESTADVYVREKRNVVVEIWGQVAQKVPNLNLGPGRERREDLSHPDWADPLPPPAVEITDAGRTATRTKQKGKGRRPPQHPQRTIPLEVLCDRRQLEDAYVATHGSPKPRLELRGSDGYLKKQWRMIAKGELGYIPAKHIVSALPEEGERPSSTHKKITVDGWDREDEEEVRSHTTSWRQLERLDDAPARQHCRNLAT